MKLNEDNLFDRQLLGGIIRHISGEYPYLEPDQVVDMVNEGSWSSVDGQATLTVRLPPSAQMVEVSICRAP